MPTPLLRRCLLAGLLLAGGCHSSPIQLPKLRARHPAVEKAAYRLHDPFPDDTLGPETQIRPRGFDLQRTEPRRAAEVEALLHGTDPAQPGPPTSGHRYPGAVRY